MSEVAVNLPGGGTRTLTTDELHGWVHVVLPQLGFIGIHLDTLDQVEGELAAMLNEPNPDRWLAYLGHLHGEVQRLLVASEQFSHEQPSATVLYREEVTMKKAGLDEEFAVVFDGWIIDTIMSDLHRELHLTLRRHRRLRHALFFGCRVALGKVPKQSLILREVLGLHSQQISQRQGIGPVTMWMLAQFLWSNDLHLKDGWPGPPPHRTLPH